MLQYCNRLFPPLLNHLIIHLKFITPLGTSYALTLLKPIKRPPDNPSPSKEKGISDFRAEETAPFLGDAACSPGGSVLNFYPQVKQSTK
jgi:hypothetical protein